MTEKAQLAELLHQFGIPYVDTGEPYPDCDEPYSEIVIGKSEDYPVPPAPCVEGYSGFFARFSFNNDGAFVKLGVWE